MQKAALLFPKTDLGSGTIIESPSEIPATKFSLIVESSDRPQLLRANDESTIETLRLPRLMQEWFADCQISNHSDKTIGLRRVLCERLLWFLENRQFGVCGKSVMRHFFAYLGNAHLNGGSRWNRPEAIYRKALSPATIKSYFGHLKTFFAWLVSEEFLPASPMARLSPPNARAHQIQPFTDDQIEALLAAARKTKYPRRDYALVLTLLDSGMRTSELCNLRMEDLDLTEGMATVLGKGNKRRPVCFGRKTARALRAYIRDDERGPKDAVFLSERGSGAGSHLTRWGVRQIIERLGLAAGLPMAKCGAHKLRHTMAITYLRHGGNMFTLQHLMGHTTLKMTSA